jgi:peptidoglycan/xylan/chitin deacetylase (PgdA/CDA1 family)
MRNQSDEERARSVAALADSCGVRTPTCDDLYLRSSDLKTLNADGHEVGSHTLTHPNLAKLGADELEREIGGSRVRLETLVESPVVGLAYPFGKPWHVSPLAREKAQTTGYSYALTTKFGRVTSGADPYALPRIGMRNDPLVRLKVRLMGINL